MIIFFYLPDKKHQNIANRSWYIANKFYSYISVFFLNKACSVKSLFSKNKIIRKFSSVSAFRRTFLYTNLVILIIFKICNNCKASRRKNHFFIRNYFPYNLIHFIFLTIITFRCYKYKFSQYRFSRYFIFYNVVHQQPCKIVK